MEDKQQRFKRITEVILADTTAYSAIREACILLSEFFCEQTGFRPDNLENQKHIPTTTGLAVSPYAAAFCIIDIMRTRIFMRGLRDAIIERKKQQPGQPVIVFYAGTGPFATLLLPLTTVFGPGELQMVLLDINPISTGCLQQLIQSLDLSDYVIAIETADATRYSIPDDLQPDILLSETMKAGLYKEPQLTVCSHLLRQCTKDPLLVPERIEIDSCLAGNLIHNKDAFKKLDTIMRLDRDFALQAGDVSFLPAIIRKGRWLEIPSEFSAPYKRLILMTRITVFQQHRLQLFESGLTMPITIFELEKTHERIPGVYFRYVIDAEPYFEVKTEKPPQILY